MIKDNEIVDRLQGVLDNVDERRPSDIIGDIVDLARDVDDSHARALFEGHPVLTSYRPILTDLYRKYILSVEEAELARLVSRPTAGDQLFGEMAGEAALMAYNRVSDMFQHVDFLPSHRFVMVGCGQMPVTALHVNDRTQVGEIICLDVSDKAVAAVEALGATLNTHRLQAFRFDGQKYDYCSANVIYIANMVSPKISVVSRVLDTADRSAAIIIREPYSFGRLWAECAEDFLDSRLVVKARGCGSRYLSRDVYFQRR